MERYPIDYVNKHHTHQLDGGASQRAVSCESSCLTSFGIPSVAVSIAKAHTHLHTHQDEWLSPSPPACQAD